MAIIKEAITNIVMAALLNIESWFSCIDLSFVHFKIGEGLVLKSPVPFPLTSLPQKGQ